MSNRGDGSKVSISDRIRTWKALQVLGAVLLLVAAVTAVAFDVAGATGPPAGSVVPDSLTPGETFTADTPFASGQQVDVTVPANSVLTPGLNAYIVECAAPGGVPPTQSSDCDGTTIQGPSLPIESDGSLDLQAETGTYYTVYALPDSYSLGESPSGQPVCNLSNECILYIGQDQNDLTQPHFWSTPFYVAPQATDDGQPAGDGSAPPAPTAASPTLSTVTAGSPTVTADGQNSTTVTVTLLGTGSVPTPDKTVTLTTTGGSATISPATAVTNSDGVATFTVQDTTAEAVVFSADDTTDSVVPTETASVTFDAPVVTPSKCSITASPPNVPADGTTASTVTVTLNDQGPAIAGVAGRTVELTVSGGSSEVSPSSAVTNAEGQAVFSVTDTATETVTYSATDTTDELPLGVTTRVTFGTLTVSAAKSTVTAPAIAKVGAAGTVSGTTVTVTLLAGDGVSALAGKTMSLAASSSNATITDNVVPEVTNDNGQATFQVNDPDAESVVFTATDVTDANLVITQTATVDFQEPTASASKSEVSSETKTAPADGQTQVEVNVVADDQFGEPLAGQVLKIEADPDTSVQDRPYQLGSTPAGTTSASGAAEFLATDQTAETVVFSIVDTSAGNLKFDQTVTVTFVAGIPDGNQTEVAASPAKVPADGKTASTVTVTVKDHFGNVVSGQEISLSENGKAVVSPTSDEVTTNAKGQAVFTATDTTNEVVTFKATDDSDGLPITQKVSVTFGNPPVPPPVPADCAVVAASGTDAANGSSGDTITVMLFDASADPVPGQTVALTPSSGTSSSVSPTTAVTNAQGVATFTVTDATVQTVTYTATDMTDHLAIAGRSVTVSFTTAPPGSSTTTPSGSTTPIVATGNTGSGSTSSGSGGSGSGSGSLAFTGAPTAVGWLVVVGIGLLLAGTVGRRRAAQRQVSA